MFEGLQKLISNQPFYFAIPLWILRFILCLFATIGGYAILNGFIYNAKQLEEKDFFGLPGKLVIFLLLISYIVLYFYVADL